MWLSWRRHTAEAFGSDARAIAEALSAEARKGPAIRVLHLFKSYYPPTHGGIEQHINEIVHGVPGIDFDVLTTSGSSRLAITDDDGVRVIGAGTLLKISTAPIVPSWRTWIGRADPDVIHLHMPNPWGEVAALRSRTKVPIVASFHGEITRARVLLPAYRAMLRRVWSRVHRVVVGSPRLLETARELDGGGRDRAVVVPYGVDLDHWSVRPPGADDIRQRFTGPLIVFLGRLRHYKGLHVLVEAMREVDGTLLVVGDGPSAPAARSAARSNGVEDRVVFVGQIPDAERSAYYHAADVFALPATNRGESYGIALVEAMATGTPVVSTELGTGTSWVNEHGRTGLVVPAGNAAALAAALRELLVDPSRSAAMGRAAQHRVAENFTRDQMLASLRGLYEEAFQAR